MNIPLLGPSSHVQNIVHTNRAVDAWMVRTVMLLDIRQQFGKLEMSGSCKKGSHQCFFMAHCCVRVVREIGICLAQFSKVLDGVMCHVDDIFLCLNTDRQFHVTGNPYLEVAYRPAT